MPFLRFVQLAHGSRMGAWPLSSLGEDQPWCPRWSASGLPQPLGWRGEETGNDFLWGAGGGGWRLCVSAAQVLLASHPPVLALLCFLIPWFPPEAADCLPWGCAAPPCAHRGPWTLEIKRGLEALFSAFDFICVRREPQPP